MISVPVSPTNNISTSLPTKIRIQGNSVSTDNTNTSKQDTKDGKNVTGTKLLPVQTVTTNGGAPQQNGLTTKPTTVASTQSPTSVASAIPVVPKGNHFQVQSGAMAQVGQMGPNTRFAHVFPSNALSKVGVMTVPAMQGPIARVPIQMSASTSAPLLMRSPAPSVGKVSVTSSAGEILPDLVHPQSIKTEPDDKEFERKNSEKSEMKVETESREKEEESKRTKDTNAAESSKIKNVPNFLDDFETSSEKKATKSESQTKLKKSDTQKEKDEKPKELEENKDLVPVTVQNLEEDMQKKSKERTEMKSSEKVDSDIKEQKNGGEIKKEPSCEESVKLAKENKKTESESKKSEKAKEEDFDPIGAMDWKDGVGELEGSNLKVF